MLQISIREILNRSCTRGGGGGGGVGMNEPEPAEFFLIQVQ